MRVEVAGLSKRFGRIEALREVGFELEPGCRAALVGPNGSGKSTLNRVLAGLLQFEGSVRLDGYSPLEVRPEVARRVAYVPQIAPALAVPVRELLRALAELRGVDPAQIEKAALRLGLEPDALAARPLRALSGGMRQKLMIALALGSGAELLIMDEPTGSLDPRSRERFFALCTELPAATSVLLCSHRLEEVRQLVERVLVLDEGRLVHDGMAAEFLTGAAACLIELVAEGEPAGCWLSARGFERLPGGGWQCITPQAKKTALLRELIAELGESLCDLSVRDLESLDLESPRAEHERS